MEIQDSCMCMSCGRVFTLEVVVGQDINDQTCPVCGGGNVVEHDPQSFFESIFGGAGGT